MFDHARAHMVALSLIGLGLTKALALNADAGEAHSAVLDGIKVHYTNYGSGDTALVFIHGWACDETVWRDQAAPLAKHVRVITIDLPGHGQSDKPEISYNMTLYARAIDAVLRDASVNSAILVGHSNGTPAVRQFYRLFPAKVRALVIVEGNLRPFLDAASMEKFIAPFQGDHYAETAGRFIDGITHPIASESLRSDIKTLMLRTPQRVAVSEFESTADPALWKEEKIDVPVVMILAKQPAWTPEYEQFVRRLVPNLDYQIWDHVSHFVMMEKPREFNDAVLAFLQNQHLLQNRS